MVSRSAIHMPKIPMARQLGSMPTSKRCQHSPIRLDNTPSLSLVGAGRHPEITNQFRLNDRERVGELAYSISPQFGHSSSNARSDPESIKQASKAVLIHGPGLNPNPLDSTMSVESSVISISAPADIQAVSLACRPKKQTQVHQLWRLWSRQSAIKIRQNGGGF